MGDVLALGEIAVHDHQRLTLAVGEDAIDESLLGLFAIAGKALVQLQGRQARQQGHAVMTLLAMVVHVITQGLDLGPGKLVIRDLGFLQSDHIRLIAFDDGRKLMRSCAQAIDIEANYLHDALPKRGWP